jgi:hypothetical protein
MKDAYGFTARPKDTGWPKTRRAEVSLTREESEGIQSASKISGFTLTHLGMYISPLHQHVVLRIYQPTLR